MEVIVPLVWLVYHDVPHIGLELEVADAVLLDVSHHIGEHTLDEVCTDTSCVVFLAVVVPSCDTAHWNLVTLGRCVKPCLLDLVNLLYFLARVVFKNFIGCTFLLCLVFCWTLHFLGNRLLGLRTRKDSVIRVILKHLLNVTLADKSHSAAQP